jgi:tetratricopeptide (TPR) repeat protein
VNLNDSCDLIIKRDIDSALFYYLKLNKKYPGYRSTSTLDYISNCYFEKKDDENARLYALKVLAKFKTADIEKDDYCFECNSASYRIGYIYQSQKQFKKAIAYYDSCNTKYKTFPQFCSIGYYLDQIPKDHDLFICYRGLGSNKKALSYLTQYMFDSTINYYVDSALINDYENLLFSLYTKEDIKKELQLAADSMYYNITVKKNENGKEYDFDLHCWTTVFGDKVYFAEWTSWRSDINEVTDWNTKESMLERLKRSVGYERLFKLTFQDH